MIMQLVIGISKSSRSQGVLAGYWRRHREHSANQPLRAANIRRSTDYSVNEVTFHIGQPHIATAETERAAGVVDPQQVQHRGV